MVLKSLLHSAAFIALSLPLSATEKPVGYDKHKLIKKLKKTNFERLHPPSNLPEHHRYLGFVITGKINGQELYTQSVPVLAMDEKTFEPRAIAEIPVGTKVSLESIINFMGRHFYRVKRKDGQPFPEDGWVDGLFIAPTGEVSSSAD